MYEGGTSVALLPGFDAKAGTVTGAAFIASIGPVITTTSATPVATAEKPYTPQPLTAAEGTTTTGFTWPAPGLAAYGLSLSAGGVITGTPASSISFLATATDAAGNVSLPQSISLNVEPSLSITTSSLPTGVAGSNYSASTGVMGGTAPFTWSISSGTLPTGLALNSSTATFRAQPPPQATTTSHSKRRTAVQYRKLPPAPLFR